MKADKISFLITGTERGGAETQLLRLATKLRDEGREVHLISMLPPDPVGGQDFQISGIDYHSLQMERGKATLKDLWRAIRLLRRLSPDVLTCFCFHANILGSLAGRIAAVPVVISSIRGEKFGSKNRELLEKTTDLFRLRDAVTTNSQRVADSLIARKITSKSRTIVIPNGIITQVYRSQPAMREAVREKLEVKPDDFLWLAVGNLRTPKDYPNLLRAFLQLQKRQSNSRMMIAGAMHDPQVVAEVQRYQGRADGRVSLLGARDDIPELLAAADAFVLSSAHEGLPNVVMEALAASTPVVTTDVGGVRELVSGEQSGYIVPRQNSAALAEGMEKMMMLTPEQRVEMGSMGEIHIRDNFALGAVVRQWDDLFSQTLENKQRGIRRLIGP